MAGTLLLARILQRPMCFSRRSLLLYYYYHYCCCMLIMQEKTNAPPPDRCPLQPALLLLVKALQILDVLARPEEDGQPLMDPRRLDVQDPLRPRGRAPSGLFAEEGHGEGLVQDPELSVLRLGITGVTKDSSVQQGSVDVGNHGSDVSGRVGGFVILGVFDRFDCRRHGSACWGPYTVGLSGTSNSRYFKVGSWKYFEFPSLNE